MNKIKKIFTSFGVFFASMVPKVLASDFNQVSIEDLYERIGSGELQAKYGVYNPIMETLKIGSVILFIIGLLVVLNKKITKKVKTIAIAIISILLIIGILGLMWYLHI